MDQNKERKSIIQGPVTEDHLYDALSQLKDKSHPISVWQQGHFKEKQVIPSYLISMGKDPLTLSLVPAGDKAFPFNPQDCVYFCSAYKGFVGKFDIREVDSTHLEVVCMGLRDLRFSERRLSFRVKTGGKKIELTFVYGQKKYTFELLDISQKGLSFRFPQVAGAGELTYPDFEEREQINLLGVGKKYFQSFFMADIMHISSLSFISTEKKENEKNEKNEKNEAPLADLKVGVQFRRPLPRWQFYSFLETVL